MLTGQQLSAHVHHTAAAGLSQRCYGDGVALAALQSAHLTRGLASDAGDGAARQLGGGGSVVHHGTGATAPGEKGRP